jgi:hypothetical protein
MTQRFGDVVQSIGELDPDLMICALPVRPLTQESPVALVNDRDPIPAGFKYLLDVFLAIEVLRVWSDHRRGLGPSVDEAVEAITYYGDRDAYVLPHVATSEGPKPIDAPDLQERVESIERAMLAYLNRPPTA